MSFPNTLVLDDFNRGSLGGNWTVPLIDANGLTSPNGTQLPGTIQFTDGYYNAATVIDTLPIEAFATVAVKNPTGANESVMPYTVNVSSKNGYAVEFDGTVASVFKVTAGSSGIIGSTIACTLVNGDVVGFSWVPGGTINVYQNGTLVGTRSDATFSAMDKIGLEVGNDATIRIDNFGGGNQLVALVQASPFVENLTTFGNVTPTFATPTVAGHLLIAFLMTTNNLGLADPTATLPAGWVRREHLQINDGSSDSEIEIFEYPNCPGEITSVAIDPDSSVPGSRTWSGAVLAEFSGLITSPFDSQGDASNTLGTPSVATASPNPAAATDLGIFLGGGDDPAGVNPAIPSGFFDIGSNSDSGSTHACFRAAFKPAIGSGTFSGTSNIGAMAAVVSYLQGVQGMGPTAITKNQTFTAFPKQLVRR